MATILVIHGPNLNLLGQREAALYGTLSLKALNEQLQLRAGQHQVDCFQSNAEHEIIDKIQASKKNKIDAIVINPGAFAHTSIALRDAFLATEVPFFEVHLTNIYARESFRHRSYLTDIAVGVISGLGPQGYYAALAAALDKFS
jgi:3-dehydroquinate dehydratase II